MLKLLINIVLATIIATILIILGLGIAIKYYNKRTSAKKLQEIIESSPYKKAQPIQKPNSELLYRDKENEKELKEEKSTGVTKYRDPESPESEISIEDEKNESRIVGVVEPKGFWSKFIMSQKLGYIIARIQGQKSEQGFWANLIKAQSASQGKDHSRNR
jgi:hypothetical protein